jgi:hypothetical protein
MSDGIDPQKVWLMVMRRDFDIFEKLPDGSLRLRASVIGKYQAERQIHEFAENSSNEFFAVDPITQELISLGPEQR